MSSALLAQALQSIGRSVAPSQTNWGALSPQQMAMAQQNHAQFAQNGADNAAQQASLGAPQPVAPGLPAVPQPASVAAYPAGYQPLPTNGFQAMGQKYGGTMQHLGGMFNLGAMNAGAGPNS